MRITVVVMFALFAILVAVMVVAFSRLTYDDRITHMQIGGVMIVFATLDKVCYVLSLICLIVGVTIGILMIWITALSDVGFKIIGTAGLVFVLSVSTLFLNKLIRSAGKYTDGDRLP